MIKKRYAVRKFDSRPVEPEKLPQVLEIGRQAPTACNNENSGIIDASIVTTYLMLAISNLDMGSCRAGHFDPQAIIKKFNFPAGMRAVAVLPFGYPAAASKPSHFHDKRSPLVDTVSYGS